MGDVVIARDIPWLVDLYQNKTPEIGRTCQSPLGTRTRYNDAIAQLNSGAGPNAMSSFSTNALSSLFS